MSNCLSDNDKIMIAVNNDVYILTASKERAEMLMTKAEQQGYDIEAIAVRSLVYNHLGYSCYRSRKCIVDDMNEILSAIGIYEEC